jgi:hypothetical protein
MMIVVSQSNLLEINKITLDPTTRDFMNIILSTSYRSCCSDRN